MKGAVLAVLCAVALTRGGIISNQEDVTIAGHGDPSEAPAICAAPDSDGVLVAHENCRQFYKCSFGLPVALRCPSNLLYDFTVERCEWPETVECGDRVILDDDSEENTEGEWDGNGAGNSDPSQAGIICAAEGSDHSYVAHEYCDKFYQCWAGLPVALDCPIGLLFNPNKDYCDFPDNVDCGDRVISENPGNGSESGNNTDNIEEEIPVGDNHNDPSQASTICGSENSDGVLVAHENCNQFYKCAHGIPVEQICSSSLLFDPSKDRCEWPETVDCGDRVIPDVNDNDNGNNEWTGNGAGNDDPSQAAAICAAEGSDHSYVAHEDCDKYYQCWAGHPVALNCPSGYLFNPNQDYCDFPNNVDCGDRVISSNSDSDNQNDGINIYTDDEEPVGNNHDDPSQAPAICGTAESEGVLVAHENCNQFYKCAHGIPISQICPGGLLFDPSKDRCEWPETVNCGDRIIPEDNGNDNGNSEWTGNGAGNDDPSQAPAICAAENSDHSYVAHEYCDKYYQCWAGHPVALNCPSGYLFNPNKDYCDFPDNVDCGDRLISENQGSENDNQGDSNDGDNENDVPVGSNHDDPSQASTLCNNAESDGVLVAHENCNQFYKCAHGLPVAQICSAGLLFDPSKDRCEWPETVDCGDRVIPEVNDNDNGNNEWTGNGAGNDDPSQAAAICAAEGSDHSYVAHEDCDKYYQCWSGYPVALDCPSGYLFNPSKDYCDFPYNVDCGDRLVTV